MENQVANVRKVKTNFEILQEENVVTKDISLETATDELTDVLNCVECIALEQCSDCYGKATKEEPRCREVVLAYLKQDYLIKDKK